MPTTNGSPVSALSGLASIIIPCCGMLEYTRLLVPSLLRHTREPFELIFIDIGSLDGTAEYLDGVGAAARVHVEVVRTETDLGIGEAVRTALARAAGEYIVLLNNDTIVTENWLNQLAGLASSIAGVGLAGPMSNYAAPPQLVESVPYRIGVRGEGSGVRSEGAGVRGEWHSGQSRLTPGPGPLTPPVDAFAKEWREKHRKKWLEVERLGGFCLLIKRAVLDKIGPELDECSDLGLFDTDILSAKARAVGYNLAVCRDLFVHHFGTRTFAHGGAGMDN